MQDRIIAQINPRDILSEDKHISKIAKWKYSKHAIK